MEKARGNRYKLHHERFYSDIKQTFFFLKKKKMRKILHWNNLHRDTVESPLPEVFKIQLDRVLDSRI